MAAGEPGGPGRENARGEVRKTHADAAYGHLACSLKAQESPVFARRAVALRRAPGPEQVGYDQREQEEEAHIGKTDVPQHRFTALRAARSGTAVAFSIAPRAEEGK